MISEKAAAITRMCNTPETGAGLGMTPGVGVGSGIEGLGAKLIIGPLLCAFAIGVDDRFDRESNEKMRRASIVTLCLFSIAMISSTEALRWRSLGIHKVFSLTEECTPNGAASRGLTITVQRYCSLANSEII